MFTWCFSPAFKHSYFHIFYIFFQGIAFLPSFATWLHDFCDEGDGKAIATLALELKNLLKGLSMSDYTHLLFNTFTSQVHCSTCSWNVGLGKQFSNQISPNPALFSCLPTFTTPIHVLCAFLTIFHHISSTKLAPNKYKVNMFFLFIHVILLHLILELNKMMLHWKNKNGCFKGNKL